MTIREMIEALETIEKEHGNVEVKNFWQNEKDKEKNVPMEIKVRLKGELFFGEPRKTTYVDII